MRDVSFEDMTPNRLTPELLRELRQDTGALGGPEDERDARKVMYRELRRAADAVGAFACGLFVKLAMIAAILGALLITCSAIYMALTGMLPAWIAMLR